MFHIHTPEPSTGRTKFLGVEFVDGVAHVEDLHPVRKLALIQHGYTVEHELVAETLESKTVPQLRAIAKQEGIDLPAKAKKADIIAALSEGSFVPIPGSIENGDGSFTAPGIRELADAERVSEAYIPVAPQEE